MPYFDIYEDWRAHPLSRFILYSLFGPPSDIPDFSTAEKLVGTRKSSLRSVHCSGKCHFLVYSHVHMVTNTQLLLNLNLLYINLNKKWQQKQTLTSQ